MCGPVDPIDNICIYVYIIYGVDNICIYVYIIYGGSKFRIPWFMIITLITDNHMIRMTNIGDKKYILCICLH